MKPIQIVKYCSLAILASMLAACSPKVDNRGYVGEGAIRDQVTIGTSTRQDVLDTLGSPSSQSSFGEETWYYVSARKETVAFLKPEVEQQDVVRISFDQAGVVSKVESFDKNNAREFELVKRVTPTEGHTLGFFEQVLGNIGRFNRPQDVAAGSAAPGRKQSR